MPTPVTLDWTPLLGMTGVFLWTYLQALDADQRDLRPLLLPPAAPSPALLQARLGLAEPGQLLGPLYLLTVAGLRQRPPWVPVTDPAEAHAVGPPPLLAWAVLDRVLTALLPALDPTHPEHAEADAALRVLAAGGILADGEPADIFYLDGAWPQLLPLVIADRRWVRLFTALHGAAALRGYRRRARAWVDLARHARARRDQAQADLAAYLLAVQRQAGTEDGGSAAPAAGGGPGDPAGLAVLHPASVPFEDQPTDAGVPDGPVDTGTPDDRTPTYIPTITAGSRPVARDWDPTATPRALSLVDHADVAAGSRVTATSSLQRPPESSPVDRGMSLADRSLTGDSCTTQDSGNDSHTRDSGNDTITSDIPRLVERHLRAAECFSTRQDAAFWCEVNRILSGSATRYPHTPGEKKAAERHFKRQHIPIGVILAALRAVMTLPDRPRTFAAALALDAFHAAVEYTLTRLPVPSASTWHGWLHAYRRIGRGDRLRDVGPADYAALQALFQAQPERCRQVIERWAEVPPPRVSPATLRRALMQARGEQPPFPWTSQPAHAADDPRRALLLAAGLSPKLLTPGMTEDYLRAWLAEADARAAELKSRLGWLTWGIRSGVFPQDHPQLQAKRPAHRPAPPVPLPPSPPISAEQQAWQAVWSAVQTRLAAHLPVQDYATWLQETALLDLAAGQAIVGTPNIFARETVAEQYAPLIAQALEQHTRQPVQVQVVLEQSCAGYGGSL